MALISALGLGPRAVVAVDPELVAARRDVVYHSGLSLRDAAVDIADAVVIIIKYSLKRSVRPMKEYCWVFPLSLSVDWGELFPSLTDYHTAIYTEYVNPARITIEAELARAGLMRYKVKDILLDPDRSAFVVTLHWVKEPSRLKKFLRSRAH
jgi:hypothetical protein